MTADEGLIKDRMIENLESELATRIERNHDDQRLIREQEDKLIDMADRIASDEATIEGLAQANTDLERETEQHRWRYNRALALVEAKQNKIEQQKSHIEAIGKGLAEVSGAYLKLIEGVQKLGEVIGALRDVPAAHYDDAVDAVQGQAYKLISE